MSTASAISRSACLLVAAATTCLVAAAASALPDAEAKHCRVCRVGGSLTLQVQPKPQDREYPLLVYVVATGGVSSKQKLCRKAGSTEIWRRLSDGTPDRDIGNPQHSSPRSYLSEASFDIDDGNDVGNPLTRYPPGSTVEFWAVRPKYKTSSGIIGSPVYKCKRLESPHVFVPVPNPPPSSEG